MTRNDDGAAPAAGRWRPVLAALANAEQRLLLAEVIIEEAERHGTSVPQARRAKGQARLADVGLLAPGDDGGWQVDAAGLRALLTASAAETRPPSGDVVLDRFVRDGRIHAFPSKPAQRRRLLEWSADQVISTDDVLTEVELSTRLAELTDDPAALRRHLVDADLLTRAADGSDYRLAGDGRHRTA